MTATDRSARLLVGLLAAAGAAHMVAPKPFDATIPQALPGSPRAWTHASGVVELLLAAGVAVPRTRRVSAVAAACFFAGVFPANVKMAYDWRHKPAALKSLAYARLPLQVPLVLWAAKVGREAAR
ncbi:DoxX family protein [Streptomyces albidochromogenes]|uniref:DoxX family membrane protein n=1 Tax=Streptomyces albidochromogenes TaxID=329524 RepID=A0ABW6FQ61_9ACTN